MIQNIEDALSPDAHTYLREIEKADIMVGIPAYNNVLTAAYVLSQVAKGLVTYFPEMKSVVFVSDGNSVDGTMMAAKAVTAYPWSEAHPCYLCCGLWERLSRQSHL